jgi:hypothetical protein
LNVLRYFPLFEVEAKEPTTLAAYLQTGEKACRQGISGSKKNTVSLSSKGIRDICR